MRSATSLTLPPRPTGICATSCSFRSPVSAPPLMSVSMKPGATELAVIPLGPNSRASARAKPSSAAFAAETAFQHARHDPPGDVVGAADVHGEDPVPLLTGNVKESGWRGDAGVVDQCSDWRHRSIERGQPSLYRRLVGHVATNARGLHVAPVGHLVCSFLCAGLVKIEDGDVP